MQDSLGRSYTVGVLSVSLRYCCRKSPDKDDWPPKLLSGSPRRFDGIPMLVRSDLSSNTSLRYCCRKSPEGCLASKTSLSDRQGFLVVFQGLFVAAHAQIRPSDIVVGNRQMRMRGLQDFFSDRQGFLVASKAFSSLPMLRIRHSDIAIGRRQKRMRGLQDFFSDGKGFLVVFQGLFVATHLQYVSPILL